MQSVTMDAVKAVMKADPTVTPAQRAQLLAILRNPGKQSETPRLTQCEQRILQRAEVARRFNRSLRFVDKLAKGGILRRVKLPGRTRACGFLAVEVERVMTGEGVEP
jgi:hypothetical protein